MSLPQDRIALCRIQEGPWRRIRALDHRIRRLKSQYRSTSSQFLKKIYNQ